MIMIKEIIMLQQKLWLRFAVSCVIHMIFKVSGHIAFHINKCMFINCIFLFALKLKNSLL